MTIDEILKKLGCRSDLLNPDAWRLETGSIYSIEELKFFMNLGQHRANIFAESHKEFLKKYESLSTEEKNFLKDYTITNFVNPQWIRGKMNPADPDPNLRLKMITEKLKDFSESCSILEIGSHHGLAGCLSYFIPNRIKAKLFTCDLLDLNNQYLRFLGIETQFWDSKNIKLEKIYKQDFFDAVVCTEVLEHLDASCEYMLLNNVHKIIKPGGRLLLSFPKWARPENYSVNVDPLGHRRQPIPADVIQHCANLKCIENFEYKDYKLQEGFWLVFEK